MSGITSTEFKRLRSTYIARQNGETPIKSYKQVDRISGIQDRINALEERREIEAASQEVWDLH